MGEDVEVEVTGQITVRVYCSKCSEELNIEEAKTLFRTDAVEIEVSPHKCKQ